MSDEQYTFTQARARLEEIVTQVRRKDVSLEKSLDLLEEGVRLANACTEAIDHTEWRAVAAEQVAGDSQVPLAAAEAPQDGASQAEGDVESAQAAPPQGDLGGDGEVAEVVEITAVEIETVDGDVLAAMADIEFLADADEAWPDEVMPDATPGAAEEPTPE